MKSKNSKVERTRVSFDGRPELGEFLNGVTEVILIQVQMSILEMIFFSFIVHHHDYSINFNIGDYRRDSFSREGVSLGHPRLFFNLGGEEGGYFFLTLIFCFYLTLSLLLPKIFLLPYS